MTSYLNLSEGTVVSSPSRVQSLHPFLEAAQGCIKPPIILLEILLSINTVKNRVSLENFNTISPTEVLSLMFAILFTTFIFIMNVYIRITRAVIISVLAWQSIVLLLVQLDK